MATKPMWIGLNVIVNNLSMSFRFQKRVKIGKGLGVNISKSGITPSYRSKKGSVSSKGYSVRTGIPGLNYRKSFSKSSKSGCVILFFVFITSITTLVILI